jgi:hypothetical protein
MDEGSFAFRVAIVVTKKSIRHAPHGQQHSFGSGPFPEKRERNSTGQAMENRRVTDLKR